MRLVLILIVVYFIWAHIQRRGKMSGEIQTLKSNLPHPKTWASIDHHLSKLSKILNGEHILSGTLRHVEDLRRELLNEFHSMIFLTPVEKHRWFQQQQVIFHEIIEGMVQSVHQKIRKGNNRHGLNIHSEIPIDGPRPNDRSVMNHERW